MIGLCKKLLNYKLARSVSMTNPTIPNQIKQEIILGTSDDDSKDWLTRVIESAERQYRALEQEGKTWGLETKQL